MNKGEQNLRRLAGFGAMIAAAVALLMLPLELQIVVFAGLTLAAIGVILRGLLHFAQRQRWIRWAWERLKKFNRQPPAPDKPAPRWLMAGEILILVVVTGFATSAFVNSPSDYRVPGHELEWLTGHVTLAHQALVEYGDIPLWNPYYRTGEPLIDNAFSYITSPLSSLPGLLFGSPTGTRLAIPLNAFFVALGGWYLARVLGLAAPGRLLLGLLLLGKGNFHTMILAGYFQLAIQQAYFPWIIAGTLQTLRTRERTPVILTGIMMALMFMAGNVWYILPMVMSCAALTIAYLFYKRPKTAAAETPTEPRPGMTTVELEPLESALTFFPETGFPAVTAAPEKPPMTDKEPAPAADGRSTLRPYNESRLNWRGVWRMGIAAVIMLTFSAIYTLPVLTNYDHIGSHDNEIEAGWVVSDHFLGMMLYANEDVASSAWDLPVWSPRYQTNQPGAAYFYYSFIAPPLLLLLVFVVFPPIYPWLHRPAQRDHWRIWLAGFACIVLMTMWGLGGS